ncbi:hypothetical protein AB0877_21475 [Micromonospora sp. NPDC047644]|uniref:hypothetical protein n=1 Tax=Micromonospora sp. NPDC047644 TaxID=3157203 RepID=UPI00345419CE
MTQPSSYPTPPAGGPRPTAGGFAPPPGPNREGYAPQYRHAEFEGTAVVKVSQ